MRSTAAVREGEDEGPESGAASGRGETRAVEWRATVAVQKIFSRAKIERIVEGAGVVVVMRGRGMRASISTRCP